MRLTDFKVLTFDCYGTLIDWESGMVEALKPLTAKAGRELSRDDVLAAHAFHESTQQAQTPGKPYRDLLAVVYKRLAEEWGVHASHEDCVAYDRSVRDWPAFADSPGALRYLKGHYKLVVLSNVDNESFSFSRERLGVEFDAVFTAEDVGAYKPSRAGFDYMLAKLGRGLGGRPVAKGDILHTAESLFHDHGPANAIGLASCWIHRRHGQAGSGAAMDTGESPPRYDFRFTSLEEMAEAHRSEARG